MLALLLAVPATAAGAAVRQAGKVNIDEAVDILQIDDEARVTVRLSCRGYVEDGMGAVGCRWRSIHDQAVASWQLLNLQVRPV
ncbi:MAG: hypothetical protein HOJ56_08915, partial [Acidimicrobiaceae bacterium]|nr:hypothetical protein [Acidimicrobiaceae bacterium]